MIGATPPKFVMSAWSTLMQMPAATPASTALPPPRAVSQAAHAGKVVPRGDHLLLAHEGRPMGRRRLEREPANIATEAAIRALLLSAEDAGSASGRSGQEELPAALGPDNDRRQTTTALFLWPHRRERREKRPAKRSPDGDPGTPYNGRTHRNDAGRYPNIDRERGVSAPGRLRRCWPAPMLDRRGIGAWSWSSVVRRREGSRRSRRTTMHEHDHLCRPRPADGAEPP